MKDLYIGQYLDLSELAQDRLNPRAYYNKIKLSTGKLLSAAAEAGGILGGLAATGN